MSRRYDAVFLDMGRTLVEPRGALQDAWLELLAPLGLMATANQLAEAMDAGFRAGPETLHTEEQVFDVYDDILSRASFEGDVTKAVAQMWDLWLCGYWNVYPDVPAMLDALRSGGYAVAVVSNWTPSLRRTCDRLGLGCEHVVCSAELGFAKPDARMFQTALHMTGATRALHVGDNYEADVLGARAAGLDAAWLVRSGAPEIEYAPTISSLTDVLQLLD